VLPESSFACASGTLLLALLALLLLALFAAAALSAGGGALFGPFCAGGGGGAAAVSFGVLWLTRLPKTSSAGGGPERVSHDGAAWNVELAAASGGTLSTERSPARGIHQIVSKDRATPMIYKRAYFSMAYGFSGAARQDLPFQTHSLGAVIASRRYGLY
jgi:hypothetical protein